MLGQRDSLCRKSSRTLAILLETFATKRLALRRLLVVLSVFLAFLDIVTVVNLALGSCL